jgi:hypothetical protein
MCGFAEWAQPEGTRAALARFSLARSALPNPADAYVKAERAAIVN